MKYPILLALAVASLYSCSSTPSDQPTPREIKAKLEKPNPTGPQTFNLSSFKVYEKPDVALFEEKYAEVLNHVPPIWNTNILKLAIDYNTTKDMLGLFTVTYNEKNELVDLQLRYKAYIQDCTNLDDSTYVKGRWLAKLSTNRTFPELMGNDSMAMFFLETTKIDPAWGAATNTKSFLHPPLHGFPHRQIEAEGVDDGQAVLLYQMDNQTYRFDESSSKTTRSGEMTYMVLQLFDCEEYQALINEYSDSTYHTRLEVASGHHQGIILKENEWQEYFSSR